MPLETKNDRTVVLENALSYVHALADTYQKSNNLQDAANVILRDRVRELEAIVEKLVEGEAQRAV